MGTLYTIIPLRDDIRSWLEEVGAGNIPTIQEGRLPSLREIKTAIEKIDQFEAEYSQGKRELLVTIDAVGQGDPKPWASLSVVGAEESDDSNAPREIYFDAGWIPVMIRLLEELSMITGPLVLVPDTGETPTVVYQSAQQGT